MEFLDLQQVNYHGQRSYKMTYQLINDLVNNTPLNCAKNIANQVIFPFDPDNTDYQQYLLWLEQGNVPLPPDEVK